MEPAQQEQDEILTKLLKGRLGQDKKLKAEIKNVGRAKKEYDRNLKQNDLLLKESAGFIEAEEGEDLLRIRQKDLKPIVPVMNAERIFDLNLEYGFYNIDYTRNGNMLALAGTKGHIAILDWKKKSLRCEFNVKDKIRDIKFLQNDSMIAVAQKKFLYIYNNLGAELHRLKNHAEPLHLEYLPYHYLLASIGKLGSLIYQDISTGGTAADFHTRIQDSSCLVQNPWNAILLVGDSRGQTTMWCPNSGAPVVKMLCHKGTVNSVAVDSTGKYLVTAGTDAKMKVWDIRTYKMIHEYWNPMPASKLSISQKGLLAVGLANEIQVWKDWHGEKQKKPYLKQDTYEGRILNDLQFVPYEDFLGVGLIDGFSSILIPGSGEPNFDTFETNVFQTRKQKSEEGVQKLLDKLPADTITLDPNMIGTVDKASREVKEAERKAEEEEAEKARLMHKRKKEKMRGRSSTKEKYKKKESVYDEATRAKIKDIVNNKLKIKRLEKKKAAEERKLIENEGLFKDFNPLETLKKVKL